MSPDGYAARPGVVAPRACAWLIAVVSFLIVAQATPVDARAGGLDKSFGGDGRVELAHLSAGDKLAISADGGVIVAGSSDGRFALARSRSDGGLDRSFSGDGLAWLPNPSAGCLGGRSAHVQTLSGGRILAIGQVGALIADGPSAVCGRREAVAVFRADGSLDSSFGDDGVVMGSAVTCGTADQAGAVLPDGRIVAAGFGCDEDITIVRLLPDGSADPTFGGGDGRAQVTALEGIWPERMDLALQPDGKVVVATAAVSDPLQGEGVPTTRFALIRVGLDGLPDPTFGGGDGVVTTSFRNGRCTASSLASAVAIGKDGRIVAGGWASCRDPGQPIPVPRLAFSRYLEDGEPDRTFAHGGKARILLPVEKGMDYAYRLAIQPDGRIVAVGTNGKAFIVRLRPSGRLDRSFGQGGMLEAWRKGWLSSVAIDRAGRILVAGGRWGSPAVLGRYLAD
jgi:uncharacterized delta-60 repeat protein